MDKEGKKELSRLRTIANGRLRTYSKQREKTNEYFDFVENLKESGYGYYDRKKRAYQVKPIRGFTDKVLDKMLYNVDKFVNSERPIDVRRPSKFKNYSDRNYIAERIRAKTNDPYKVLAFIEMSTNKMSYKELLKNEEEVINLSDNEAQEFLSEKRFTYYENIFD